MASQLAGIDAWLAAEASQDMSDDQWAAVNAVVSTTLPDLGAVLRSEAVTALPHELALALARLEQIGHKVRIHTDGIREAHREVLPVWHERRAPLSDADASRVRTFRSAVCRGSRRSSPHLRRAPWCKHRDRTVAVAGGRDYAVCPVRGCRRGCIPRLLARERPKAASHDRWVREPQSLAKRPSARGIRDV